MTEPNRTNKIALEQNGIKYKKTEQNKIEKNSVQQNTTGYYN